MPSDASAYEQAFREIIRRSSHNRDYWREAVGIHIEDVYLDGSYPDTDARAFIVRGARPCHPDAINWLR